jgi:hypothetical protein
MFLYVKHDVEIAVRTAVDTCLSESREANAGLVLNTSRNFGVNSLLLNHPAFTAALGARIGDDATRALAGRASSGNTEEALLISHLTASSAAAASGGRFALRTARTMAGLTIFMPAVSDLSLGAESGFFKFDSDIFAKVRSALRARASPAAATSKDVAEAEELAENVVEILEDGRVEACARSAPT